MPENIVSTLGAVYDSTVNLVFHDLPRPEWWADFGLFCVSWIHKTWAENPGHLIVEAICIGIIVFLIFIKPYDPKKSEKLSKKEEEELIKEWTPEPLVPALPEHLRRPKPVLLVEGTTDAHVRANGVDMLNLASFNFLGLANSPEIKNACETTIMKYGVGSCGPRGFYGTIDVHLDCEKKLAEFCGTEHAILYSDGLGCISSVIAAFSKAGDTIICDQGVNFHIQQGLLLSKSEVLFFKHNDADDLERLLKEVAAKDIALRRSLNRRFIIVEGLYFNYGDVCPLPKILELKQNYKYRLIMDDSMAFGVLGEHGRGTPEHFGFKVTDVEIYCATLDAAIATCGGFCAGTFEVCNHQRLSGAGYCFSASSPPFSAKAAVVALQLIDEPAVGYMGTSRSLAVRHNADLLRSALSPIVGLEIGGPSFSPLVHIRFAEPLATLADEENALACVSEQLIASRIAVFVSQYIPQEIHRPRPSLRVIVSANHSAADIKLAASAMIKEFSSLPFISVSSLVSTVASAVEADSSVRRHRKI